MLAQTNMKFIHQWQGGLHNHDIMMLCSCNIIDEKYIVNVEATYAIEI